jgi:hypothetical protein
MPMFALLEVVLIKQTYAVRAFLDVGTAEFPAPASAIC